jgi:pyridoxal phosphate enzyme (YggS family)
MSKAENRVDIAANVARLRSRIAAAAGRRGRSPDEIRLVAAAKTVAAERVEEAIGAGVTDIGENYVQEAAEKRRRVAGPAHWHMIGHLQRNKVRQAVEVFDIIQTVDSRRLAEAIGQHAAAVGRTLPILLQVNTSGEESKFGVEPDRAEDLLDFAREIAGIRVEGLMTIGRWDPDPERARPEFRLLAELAARLESRSGVKMEWLSMGMSHDFEIAIEEGANLIRVGTGVFGPRRQ